MYRLPKEAPKTIQKLIDLACENDGNILSVIKAYKIWPAIQMKRFPGADNLIMLYNTYTREGVDDFADLYNQCRSVIIHMPTAHIVAAAKPIPRRVSIQDALALDPAPDSYEVAYEGTNIMVYNHFNKWYFSTTACLSMDDSYFIKNKSHGSMFDEALNALGLTRAEFTAKLDTKQVYSFTLVHHKNTRYTNYDGEFGPGYTKLVGPAVIPGIVTPERFTSLGAALAYLEANPHAFGVIGGGSVKITSDAILKREEVHAGWDNQWANLLNVYMLGRPIADYMREFAPESNIDPTEAEELFRVVFDAMADKIWDYYQATTNYTPGDARYTMTAPQMAVDTSLGQTMRFQLAQLRVIQTRHRRDEFITRDFVRYYLAHYRLTREVSKLIKHLASYAMFQNNFYNFSAEENAAIIRLGNNLLGRVITRIIE